MSSWARLCLIAAAFSGLVSVAVGAFAAHGIADPKAQELLRIGTGYEMTHALAVFAAVFVVGLGAPRALIAAALFLVGAALFCLPIYAVALGAPRAVGMVIPVGGVGFMAGWIVLAWACLGLKKMAP